MGASVRQAIYCSYIVAGVLASVGGVLAGFSVGHIVPEVSFWTQSGEVVFVALLGGTGGVLVAVAGTIGSEYVRNSASERFPAAGQRRAGRVVVVIIFAPVRALW